jgi:hypothetical protein
MIGHIPDSKWSCTSRDEAFTAPQATDPVFFASAGFLASEGNGTLTFSPELDPASAASGLTLLLSGLALALGARRSVSRERSSP